MTALALLAACGGTGVSGRAAPPAPSVTEAEWRTLALPRPTPLSGAARVGISGVQLAGNPPWELTSTIPLPLGFSELIAAGLIRRADVQYVERRRFAAAVSRERSGVERPAGAPPAGVSPGVELLASIVWVAIPGAEASLEVRLADAETGATVSAGRTSLPPDADPVGVARQAVAQILARLAEIGRLPAWTDPLPDAAPAAYRPSGVGREQVESFLAGLAAEEAWRWDDARWAYGRALEGADFPEASAALARAARLRLGGTLGES